MNNKTWGYIRVSSKDQNEDRQVNEILPLVSTPSHLIIEKVSGKDFNIIKYKALKDIMNEGDILFHTGMRISEFCGLTLKDIERH